MYCEYYGLKEKPFTVTPNPRFLFLSRNHREAFAHLLYGIRNHCGFIELTGEVGTGKTTVLRTLLEQLDEAECRIALILNPCLSVPELLKSICREYGLPADGSILQLTEGLNRFLLEEHRSGRTVVLVIDEAQNLQPSVLEQIRLLSNLETETDKLIQIVLAGQPELKRLLDRPDLRQLSQRITVRYHLRPLDAEDTRSYIEHRMEVAGAKGIRFHPAAVKKIHAFSGGYPRLINIACDRTLLVGYTEDVWNLTGATAATAISEIRRESGGRGRLWAAIAGAVAGGAFIVLLAAGAWYTEEPSSPAPAAAAKEKAERPAADRPGKETEKK